jgi:hypothetical protein
MSTGPGPVFSPADLGRALHALDQEFQDHEWLEGEARFAQNTLVERLRERGITRALGLALIDDLLGRSVFRAGLAFLDLDFVAPLDGRQTDRVIPNRFLHTTRERWYGYLAEPRPDSGIQRPPLSADQCPGPVPGEGRGTGSDRHDCQDDELVRIRALLDRLVAANERHMRARLRLTVLPFSEGITPASSAGKARTITVVLPGQPPPGPATDAQIKPPDKAPVVIPATALDGFSRYEFWGGGEIERESGRSNVLFLLVWDGLTSDAAAEEFRQLAAESGRLYQTLPPSIAPIFGTTSPRNLWASVVYAWLSGTPWVCTQDGFEAIALPFAASVELWRRLLYGTADEERVGAERGLSVSSQAQETPNRKGRWPKPGGQVELRSWTQPDLDAAIREYKAKRAAIYRNLVEAVRQGRRGAMKSAQKIFGRNAIARALGVKAPAMVSKSGPWQEIAAELQLSRKRQGGPPLARARRVGLAIAEEEKAQQAQTMAPEGLERCVHEETISLLRTTLPGDAANDAVEKLLQGKISDDEARQMVDLVRQQQQDARTRRVPRSP